MNKHKNILIIGMALLFLCLGIFLFFINEVVILAGVLLVFAVVVALINPFWGILLTIFSFPIEKFTIIEGMTPVVPIGIATGISWFFKKNKKIHWGIEMWLICFLILIGTLSMFKNGAYSAHFQSLLFGGILAFLIRNTVITLDELHVVVIISGVSIAIGGMVGIFTVFLPETGSELYRQSGLFFDPNYFSLYCLVFIPSVASIVNYGSSKSLKLFLYGVLIVLSFEFILANSRGSTATAMVILIVFLFSAKMKQKIKIIFAVVLLLVTWIYFMPDIYFKRIPEMFKSEIYYQGTAASRLESWVAGFRMFKDYPMLGVGLGKYGENTSIYAIDFTDRRVFNIVAHNSYIEIFAETGILGGMIFVVLMYVSLKNFKSAYEFEAQIPNIKAKNLFFGLYLGIIGYIVGQLFLSAQYRKYLWLLVGLSILAKEIIKGSIENAAKEKNIDGAD